MMEDFLKVVSDYDVESVDDLIVSDIREIAKRINKRGGLKRRKRWPFHF